MKGSSPDRTLLQLVVFRLNSWRLALPLITVERIVHAVAVTPLPGAPSLVLGAFDLAGRVLPVINLRRRLGVADREIALTDQFVIARSPHRTVALVADDVTGVLELPEGSVVPLESVCPGLEHLRGVVQLEDGLVLIHDIEKFLTRQEEAALATALEERQRDAT